LAILAPGGSRFLARVQRATVTRVSRTGCAPSTTHTRALRTLTPALSLKGEGVVSPTRQARRSGAQTPYADGIASTDNATSRPKRVALLVDYPVLMRAVRAVSPDAVPRLADVVRRAQTLGAVFISRAYGAWYDLDEATNAFSEGLDPVFVPPLGPGNVPSTSALITDGMSTLETGQVQALALSGDDRLLPLLSAAQERGVPVALIAHACAPDGPCVKLAVWADPAAEFVRAMTRAERYRRPTPAA
jgi:hypothetical protein